MKGLILVFCIAGLLTAPSLSLAHPHFDKSVNATLPSGAEATIAYQTVPSNEAHATGAAVGSFITPRNPSFTLSAEITAGSVTVPAGEYTIGVIKNGDADWTMALYKGTPPRGAAPDMAQMIKLDSMYSTDEGAAEHTAHRHHTGQRRVRRQVGSHLALRNHVPRWSPFVALLSYGEAERPGVSPLLTLRLPPHQNQRSLLAALFLSSVSPISL